MTTNTTAINNLLNVSNPANQITGSNLICLVGTTSAYSIVVPNGFTVARSATGSLSINANTGIATAIGNGSAVITANVSGPCGVVPFTKSVRVGAPAQPFLAVEIYGFPTTTVPVVINPGDAVTFTATSQGANDLHWTNSFGGNAGSEYYQNLIPVGVEGGYALQIPTDASPGYYSVSVTPSNGCNGITYGQAKAVLLQVTEGFYLMASPNPASEELTVEVADSTNTANNTAGRSVNISTDLPENYQITLYNAQGMAIQKLSDSQRKLKLNVSTVEEGIYYLEVIYREAVIRRRVVIRR